MKTTLALLGFLFVAACGGPEVPPAFAPESPASPGAPAPQRPSVAAVLAPADPLGATLCIKDKPCALQEAPKQAPATEPSQDHAGHHHHHHAP